MSGNGEKITHKASGIVPAGNGGGCVKTGPFKEYVHLPRPTNIQHRIY